MLQTVIAVLINGLTNGTIYALIVLGVSLILLVRRVIHFCFPYIVVMTAYLGWLVLGATNNNYFISLPAFFIIGIILVVATEPLFRAMVKRGALMESMVLGQGVAIFLTGIMSKFVNHGQALAFPSNIAGGGIGIRFGVIYFTVGNIYALVGAIIMVAAVYIFLYRFKEGRALRAMAQSPNIAIDLGISISKTGIIGFGVVGIIAGFAALCIAIVTKAVDPTVGNSLGTRAFVLMLFAGMGNLNGGMICAVGMGMLEAMIQAFVPGAWTDTITYAIIMLVILVRPDGIFGSRT